MNLKTIQTSMYAVPNPNFLGLDIICNLGLFTIFDLTISAVPSGELSSIMSSDKFENSKTESINNWIFSISL